MQFQLKFLDSVKVKFANIQFEFFCLFVEFTFTHTHKTKKMNIAFTIDYL